MREILFRGKSVDTGKWIEGFYCGENCEHPFSRNMVEKPYIIRKGTGFWFEVIPETVGQYTGLKDKNGKRIFEGDILSQRKKYTVVFNEGAFAFQIGEEIEDSIAFYDTQFTMERIDFEVIGNIHDTEGGAE